jgi:hypothetical protein
MTRLSKLLIIWLGIVLVLAACGTTELEPTAENREDGEDIATETAVSPNSAQTVPTSQPPNTPTTQPTAIQSPTPALIKADFPNLGIAPEIENEVWVNADEPVTLASQRGKVVLLEFWTFG